MTTPKEPESENALAVSPEQITLIKSTVATGATDPELQLFMYDCQRQGVHPLDRLIHFTKRGGKYTPVTSIDFMRSRAMDTGEYVGNSKPTFEGTPRQEGFKATVSILRLIHGEERKFEAEARWEEFYPGDQLGFMWKKMPYNQLAKCAEAQALRKAFPRQLFKLYTAEELEQADGRTIIPRARVPKLKDKDLSAVPVSEESASHRANADEAREGIPNRNLVTSDSRGGAQKLSPRKKKGVEIPPRQSEIIARLLEINRTTNDLVKVCEDNEWNKGESWPYSDELLGQFLNEESWVVLKAELEAVK